MASSKPRYITTERGCRSQGGSRARATGASRHVMLLFIIIEGAFPLHVRPLHSALCTLRRSTRELRNSMFPWLCCCVCAATPESGGPVMCITKPCAHFVCNACRERWSQQRPNTCPACKQHQATFESAGSDSLKPFLVDLLDSAVQLHKVLGLQNKHYVRSCWREREAVGDKRTDDVPLSKLEKETLQLECKIKQMRKWKRANATLLANGDMVLKYLMNTYSI